MNPMMEAIENQKKLNEGKYTKDEMLVSTIRKIYNDVLSKNKGIDSSEILNDFSVDLLNAVKGFFIEQSAQLGDTSSKISKDIDNIKKLF